MKLLAGIGGALAAFFLVGSGAPVLFSLAMLGAEASDTQPRSASEQALGDIPGELLPVYQAAARTCDMPWPIIAAIGKIETDHGRSNLAGVRSGTNAAGAMGPMQFLAGTWAVYGVDGDSDGTRDVYDAVDAIWGAAAYLCTNGAGDPARVRSAIWNYNHADWYVDEVLTTAGRYEIATTHLGNVATLADHPRLSLTPNARQDLLEGVVDQRIIDFLAWAVRGHTISVSVLKTGHSKHVSNTSKISNHWYGRGVDIYAVDGERVTPRSGAALGFAVEASHLSSVGRPSEIGVPWENFVAPGVFSDADHRDHLHFGWRSDAARGHLADPLGEVHR